MNWMGGFNKVINYIEEHLHEELDYGVMASFLGYSTYHFQRLFMMIAGVSLADYIRCRRLSVAALELMDGDSKVLDIALKYGYSSPTSFQRAFKSMHGVSPVDVKQSGVTIKAYPPLSFELTIKGAETMDYRIVQMDSFRIVGQKIHTTMENGECYNQIPALWGELVQTGGPGCILSMMDTGPMGLLGVSDYNPDLQDSEFDYYIAVSSRKPIPDGMAELVVPAATWAIFPCRNEDPGAIQKLQKRIVMDWLPSSGYEFAKVPDVELYHEDGSMEIWLPVIRVK